MRNVLLGSALCGVLLSAVAIGASEPSVSALIQAAKSGEESARIKAIDSLAAKADAAGEAVPALAELLKDDSALVRAHAAHALGEIGAPAKSAVSALAPLVTDPDELVQRAAIHALRHLRPDREVSIPLIAKAMQDADPAVRIRAIDILADYGADAVPGLVEALDNKEACYWACLALGEIGPEASAAVPALAKLLDDERPEVRREAAIALAEIGEASAAAVPKLIEALEDENIRTAATFALGRIGPKAKAAEAKIKRNAAGSDQFLRTVSTWALARLNPEDQQLIRRAARRMVECLKHEEPRVREAAARALADLQPGPEVMRPLLQKALEGADESVVTGALDAMASLGEQAVPRLLEALKYPDTRPKVAYILGRIGPAAKPAVGALVDVLDDPNPDARREALMALGRIGAGAKQAVPALIEVLEKGDETLEYEEGEGPARYGAAYALGSIGPSAIAAKPALQELLGSDDDILALVSGWALAQIDADCPVSCEKSLPIFIKGLRASQPMVRLHAAEALRSLGARAKPAAGALKKALRDEDEAVREAAAGALKAIGK